MSDRNWSLVFFTTLAQCSVGIILWFTWAGFFNPNLGLMNPVLLALIFIGVATLSSFLHLGNPANAPRALNNLAGSWLSREVLAIGVFSASLIFILILGWKTGNSGYLKYLMVLSSFCGLALLWMMIRIYLIPTIPAWNSWYTPVSFVATALCLGLLALLGFQLPGVAGIDDPIFNKLMVFLMLILLLETASGLFHQFRLQKLNTGIDELKFNRGSFYKAFLFRMGLLLVAFLAIFTLIFSVYLFPGYQYNTWLYTLLVLIIVQELLGRGLFYSSYFRLGV